MFLGNVCPGCRNPLHLRWDNCWWCRHKEINEQKATDRIYSGLDLGHEKAVAVTSAPIDDPSYIRALRDAFRDKLLQASCGGAYFESLYTALSHDLDKLELALIKKQHEKEKNDDRTKNTEGLASSD